MGIKKQSIFIFQGVLYASAIEGKNPCFRNQHYRNRLCGYLNFYRRTRNIRRLPLVIASAGTIVKNKNKILILL